MVYLWYFVTKQQILAERSTPTKKAMVTSSHETLFNTSMDPSANKKKKFRCAIAYCSLLDKIDLSKNKKSTKIQW